MQVSPYINANETPPHLASPPVLAQSRLCCPLGFSCRDDLSIGLFMPGFSHLIMLYGDVCDESSQVVLSLWLTNFSWFKIFCSLSQFSVWMTSLISVYGVVLHHFVAILSAAAVHQNILLPRRDAAYVYLHIRCSAQIISNAIHTLNVNIEHTERTVRNLTTRRYVATRWSTSKLLLFHCPPSLTASNGSIQFL